MGTCCEGFDKHWTVFSFMQRFAWLPQGRLHGKQKCGLRYVKTATFCTCGSNNWETVEDSCWRYLWRYPAWVHAARCLTSIELSFHPCNILRDRRGVSTGNKNVACGTWKLRFFALAVRITGKLFKIDGYMLRGVWQALNCLFIHATCCVIIAGASAGQTKKLRPGYVKLTIFFVTVVRITGKLL